MAVCGRVAVVRSAARTGQSNHRERPANGREGQDGYRRCNWPSPRKRPSSWGWARTSSMPAVGRHKASRDRASGGGHRKSRRFRPSIPGTQVSHRGCSAEARPHRRHDRRRGERCSGIEKSGLRHRRFRRDRRGPRGGVHRAAGARPIGDHRRDQGEPAAFSSG